MKATADGLRVALNLKGLPEVTVTLTSRPESDLNDLMNIISQGKELDVEIKQHRKKRSLDANAYCWVLLSKIAENIKTSKESVYLEMLQRYGVFTHVIVKHEIVDRVKAEWRTVVELGEVTVNGKTGVQLQCYFGSSTYDTKEMATLIDGIVGEAKELGIETMTPSEIALLKEKWGK